MSFPVAIQLYSLRNEAAADFFGVLEKVKEMGYDGVEFAGLHGRKPAEVREKCAALGLNPISAHVALKEMLSDPQGVLGAYREIGCKYVVVPYLVPVDRPEAARFPEVIKEIEMLCKVAKDLGMTMLYHNHDFEFVKIDGKYALDVLYDTIPADLLQTELDTCWVNVGGENPANYVRKYSGRAPVVHLKDFVGGKSENMYELIGIQSEKKEEATPKFEFRPVGYGVQDFPAILEAAKDAGSEWVVVEMDNPSMGLTPMECADKARAYLKTIGC